MGTLRNFLSEGSGLESYGAVGHVRWAWPLAKSLGCRLQPQWGTTSLVSRAIIASFLNFFLFILQYLCTPPFFVTSRQYHLDNNPTAKMGWPSVSHVAANGVPSLGMFSRYRQLEGVEVYTISLGNSPEGIFPNASA